MYTALHQIKATENKKMHILVLTVVSTLAVDVSVSIKGIVSEVVLGIFSSSGVGLCMTTDRWPEIIHSNITSTYKQFHSARVSCHTHVMYHGEKMVPEEKCTLEGGHHIHFS